MDRVVGRFAPSPTGRMHLGNVFSALISYLSAKSRSGEWILRIEDIDASRSRREWADLIQDDLLMLGLEWDRGPGKSGSESYFQSERGELYAQNLKILEEKGLTYPCWCTRSEILSSGAPHQSDGRVIYSGLCRDNQERSRLFNGRPAATRIRVPDALVTFTDRHYGRQNVNPAEECGDFILRRSDGGWAYQLAVVVDDSLMGVTEVVRGRDLLLSSAQQIFLYRQLGFPVPEFAHFPLLCSKDGARLCKRDKSLDMASLRSAFTAEQIIGKLAFHAGLIDREDPCKPSDLIPLMDWSKIPSEDICIPTNPQI